MSFRYVKGHQDDSPCTTLDHWALKNIECDLLAKLEWHEASASQYTSKDSKISFEAWSIWAGTQKITGRLQTELDEIITGGALKRYWSQSKRFNNPINLLLVNWDAIEQSMKDSSLSCRRWVTKHISG